MKRIILVATFFFAFTSFLPLNAQWARTYGESGSGPARSIQQTSDGGYIVAGYTDSFCAGDRDFWVLKLSSTGAIDWQRTYGGSLSDYAFSIQQTSDGGYFVAGYVQSLGSGSDDALVLKLSSTGDVQWQRTYGESGWDTPYSGQQTSDGGYIIAGRSGPDVWVLKLNSTGAIVWQRTYDGLYAYSIQLTSDGGYIVAGDTDSFGAGGYYFLLLKLFSDGDIDPSCEFVGSSNATITDTLVSPQDTSVTPQDTDVIPLDTICSTQDTYAVANLLCEAPKYTLTISTTDRGTTDPAPGSYIYYKRSEVKIKPIPDADYSFLHWTGDVPSGHENDNPITITMDSDKSIKANFQYTLTIFAGTGGTVDPPPGIYNHDVGTEITITATPNSGYEFSGWSGDVLGTINPKTITMNEDKSVTANFTPVIDPKSCFIATAAYGSPLHPYVETLRDFRDTFLMPSKLGSKLVDLYYKYSPSIANLIAKHIPMKVVVRISLLPLVVFSYSILNFGPTITAAMLVFIFGLPIFFIWFYRRK